MTPLHHKLALLYKKSQLNIFGCFPKVIGGKKKRSFLINNIAENLHDGELQNNGMYQITQNALVACSLVQV